MKNIRTLLFLTIALLPVCTCNASSSGNGTAPPIPTIDAAASVGYFYVGGRYVGEGDTQVMQSAGAALLDRIGPAILLTHSQAGAFGWLIADARPDLVKGMIAVEPFGPPFHDAVLGNGRARPWGLADIELTYDPPVKTPDQINIVEQEQPDAPDLYACWLQTEPARRLPNLIRIPIMVVTSEASYHAVYDHCTVRYLRQVGAHVDFVRLEDVGIHGNGHMMMLETNNMAIAAIIARWAATSIR